MSHSRIQMFKRKVVSKYNFILQEIERTNEILEKAKSEIDEKVGAFLKGEDEDFSSQFNEIDEDLELFHNKLCIIQEELEDGKLSVETGVACSLNGKKQEISTDSQSGTSQSLHTGVDTQQLESTSSSSQNDKISNRKNIFHEQTTSQHHAEKEEKIKTKLNAHAAELNISPSLCSEFLSPNSVALSDLHSLQNNAVRTNTYHSTKEVIIERSKNSQTANSNSVIEPVSSSDGSSVYGTVSSVCSEVHAVDKNEMSVTGDATKLIHDIASTSKQNGEDILRTQVIGDSMSAGIPYPDLEIGSSVIGTVQDIVNPSDFWIQIDSEYMKDLCPVEDLVAFYDRPSDVKKDMYCLAPCKEERGYFRAKILELTETIAGKQRAKVLYIDIGCRGTLSTSTLKVLPASLQKIPSIAVHCALHGVVPISGIWSHKAVEEFKTIIEVSRITITICSRVAENYFVNVSAIAKIPGNENFTYDVAQFMCAFGYALKDNDEVNIQCSMKESPESCASVANHESSSWTTCKLSCQSSLSNDLSSKTNKETFLPSKNESLCNDISRDKGTLINNFNHQVYQSKRTDEIPLGNNKEDRKSFTDNRESDRSSAENSVVQGVRVKVTNIPNFQNGAEENLPTNSVSDSVSCENSKESDRFSVCKLVDESTQINGMNVFKNWKDAEKNSFENTALSSLVNSKSHESGSSASYFVLSGRDSCSVEHNAKVPVNNSPCVRDEDSSHKCNMSPQSSCNDFDWSIKIPLPNQTFDKKAKFLVMLSAVVSPSDFYVNLAMPTSNELDELQEHMLFVYQNFDRSAVVLPPMNMLCGMFCCCQFPEDKNWYRVQVLDLCNPVENVQSSATQVRIQYIDYGNEAEVNINELLPLKKEFTTHPPFSFHCTLAGIKPKFAENSCENNESNEWDEEAIGRFKCLASFDKCYTAEIAKTVLYDARKTPIPVYLWDNISAKDILINIILVEQGAADGSELEFLSCPAEGNLQDMDLWDPMSADYNSTLNSYGVNLNDPEIATVGYKSNDERYICKFFSATGQCHRGDKCFYQHIFASGDSTIDQEPIEYLGKAVTLPEVESTVFLMISAMFNPGHFFVVFPYGTKSLESIYLDIRRCTHEEKDHITEFMDNLNKYYNINHHRKENTALASAIGDLVAVKWKDNLWYRGRVCDVFDVNAPLLVYFVDFGTCDCIERTDMYELEPQFRHFPFQAVECHLHGIEAKVSEECQWSAESKIKFQELTEGKILIAHIKNICSSSLYVELFSCVKNKEFSINDYLVQNGYGQCMKQGSCNNSPPYTNSQKKKLNKTAVFIPA